MKKFERPFYDPQRRQVSTDRHSKTWSAKLDRYHLNASLTSCARYVGRLRKPTQLG
jgi:hypothetical protein